MKRKHFFMALAAICAGFSFASCSTDIDETLGSLQFVDPTHNVPFNVTKVRTSEMEDITKASATEVNSWTTAPDKNIGVSVYSSAAGTETMKTGSTNMKWTYNTASKGWETQTPLLFFPGDEGVVTAYYPYGESVDPTSIDVDATKDYMYALIGDNKTVNYGSPQTSLLMHHANSQLRVNLIRNGYAGDGTISSFTVKGSKFASAGKLNSLTGVVSNYTMAPELTGINEGNLAADVSAAPTAKIEALYTWFVPISDAAAPVTFDATIDGLKLRYTTSQQFESGKRYTFNLAVTDNLASELILTSVDIDPWTDETYNGDMELVTPDKEPVDLGLPSGLKWAAGNVGAKNPEDAGLYFAWGETTGYAGDAGHNFAWANYKWSVDGSSSNFSKYNSTGAKLDLEDDAARANLGGSWRMPTEAEIDELIVNTTRTWTTNYEGTGKAGYIVKSKTNSNQIFMPAAGYFNGASLYYFGSDGNCWSSSQNTDYSYYGYDLNINSGFLWGIGNFRCYGCSVRGVLE